MTRLEIQWPDAGGERVRAARARLERAGEALADLDFRARVQRLAAVLEAWTAADSAWRRALIAEMAPASPFAAATIEEGVTSALRAFRPADFVACAEREIGATLDAEHMTMAPFATISVLGGGAIPMPTLTDVLLPLAVGSPVLLRASSKDEAVADLVARSVAGVDEDLGRCVEVVRFEHEDADALDAFLEAPCVMATGSDETLSHLRARLQPDQRFVGYGHKFSCAVFGAHDGDASDPDDEARATEALALDVARWDQSGCLSPVVVYLLGRPVAERIAFAGRLAEALEHIERTLPRGERSTTQQALENHERREASMRAAMDEGVRVFEGATSTVVLEADAQPRPAPLGRFLRIHPVADGAALEAALRPLARHLSNIALAGIPQERRPALERVLVRCGANRITPPGTLQTPPVDWPHDGRPIFVPLARFVQGQI